MKSYIYLILLLIVLLVVWFFWWASTLQEKQTSDSANSSVIDLSLFVKIKKDVPYKGRLKFIRVA